MDKKPLTAAEVRKAYFKEWRKKNPDKCRKYRANYWEKRALQIASETEQSENKE